MPFSSVGYNTADIQSIKITGGEVGFLGEIFSIWEGVPTVVSGSEFVYCHPSLDPKGIATECYWGDGETFEKVDYSIAPGQAVVIECAENLSVTTAGQVPAEDVTFVTVAQNNFSGNPFPSAIDIQDISISGDGVGGLGELFSIWEGVPEVVSGSEFIYCDASLDPEGLATGCYWGDGETFEKVSFTIPAGKGFVIECAEGLDVTIKAPYSL